MGEGQEERNFISSVVCLFVVVHHPLNFFIFLFFASLVSCPSHLSLPLLTVDGMLDLRKENDPTFMQQLTRLLFVFVHLLLLLFFFDIDVNLVYFLFQSRMFMVSLTVITQEISLVLSRTRIAIYICIYVCIYICACTSICLC